MRVLLVTHYFPPEVGAPQARLSELASAWVREGATVTVLTGMPNHPTGLIPAEYQGAVRREETRDGYRVLRTWLYATPNERILKKMLAHLSFAVTCVALGGHQAGSADVVIVSSPTFFSIGAAWWLARVKRARLVVEVRDFWPAIFVELGVLRNPLLIRLLELLELAAYRAADAVVVVSEGFRCHIIDRGIPGEKIVTIPNGVDLERFPSGRQPSKTLRSRLGARDQDTLVVYAGAHGISQGLPSVAEAAAELADEQVHFAFVGDGADKRHLQTRVQELRLPNVTMLPAVARRDVPEVIEAADICLVPLRNVPLFATFIPSKMFEYLAVEKPVIGAVTGEAADILHRAGGLVVPPESPPDLAAAIRKLAAEPELRARMARRGREYVSLHYDRRVLAGRYLDLLRRVVERGRP